MDSNSSIESWRTFVKAQEIFIQQITEPFNIVFSQTGEEGICHFKIQDNIQLQPVRYVLKRIFRGIIDNDIHTNEGYILYDANKVPKFSPSRQQAAALNHFEVDLKPIYSGIIRAKSNANNRIEGVNNEKSGGEEAFATLEKIDEIRSALKAAKSMTSVSNIAAIFKVIPTTQYLQLQYKKALNYLQQLGVKHVYEFENMNGFKVENSFLKKADHLYIMENTGYKSVEQMLVCKVDLPVFQEFMDTRKSRKIMFQSEDPNNSRLGLTLPDPFGNEFRFVDEKGLSADELRAKMAFLISIVYRHFDKQHIELKHINTFRLNKDVFFECIKRELYLGKYRRRFSVSSTNETVSFDFLHRSDLHTGLQPLYDLQMAKIEYKGEYVHEFKIKFDNFSPLSELQEQISAIPGISTELTGDGARLSFSYQMEKPEQYKEIRDDIENIIANYNKEHAAVELEAANNGKLQYAVKLHTEAFEAAQNKKFSKLLGDKISLLRNGEVFHLGIIKHFQYPDIGIDVKEMKEEVCEEGAKCTVAVSLDAGINKTQRFLEGISELFARASKDKLACILRDPGKATIEQEDISLPLAYLAVKQELQETLLSQTLNEEQVDAVTRSLLAENMFVIKGGPGTGKSAVVREIIWQHIRKNKTGFNVLVSAPSMQGVDNTLEKLRHPDNMLIKPLRCTSEDRQDRKSSWCSLEVIKAWAKKKKGSNTGEKTNVVEDWLGIIAKRSEKEPWKKNLKQRWMDYLENGDPAVKGIFLDSYLRHVNVVGAKASSIGKTSSGNTFSNFFSNYNNVYHPAAHKAYIEDPHEQNRVSLHEQPVLFDLVVMDDAGQAIPPELVVPCLYGKKAILLGDNKQLPPFLNTPAARAELTQIARQLPNSAKSKEVNQVLHTINNAKDDFNTSHFESLYNGIHDIFKAAFTIQYRMHPAIGDVVSQFYTENGGLTCGISPELLNNDDLKNPLSRFHGITHTPDKHVIWLHVDTPESVQGKDIINHGEVAAIHWLLNVLEKSPAYARYLSTLPYEDIAQKRINMTSFSEGQLELIHFMRQQHPKSNIFLAPIERFTSVERDIMVISMVHSPELLQLTEEEPVIEYEAKFKKYIDKQEARLNSCNYEQLLNTVMSRTKRLLIIVGNSLYFRQLPFYNNIVETIARHPNGELKVFDPNSNVL